MPFEYTSLMKNSLEQMASAHSFSPGLSLMGAIRELKAIRGRSIYPARFQLLQFIEAQPHSGDTETTYCVPGSITSKDYCFKRLSCVGDIAKMSKKDLQPCVDWLTERALSLDSEQYRDKNYYRHVFGALIEKNGWMRYRESDQRYLNRLFNRHYAYEMGHYLGFTLKQMQDFMDRVLPDEIYINRDAEDLIEAYAFEHGQSCADVARMLSAYRERASLVDDSYDIVDIGSTHQLYQEAASFEGGEDELIDWLLERSSVLEGRSRTAFAVYQNLLLCAYLMMHALYDGVDAGIDDPVGMLWENCIECGEDMRDFYEQFRLRYGLPALQQMDWKKAASEFNEFSEWAPSEKRERKYPRDFLTYLSVDKNGEFICENTFSRIPQIMEQGRAVQKRDVLCLLWLIYTLAWEDVAPEDISGQLRDFIDLATGVLEQCNFTFYLPHLLEYSICRSLIIGGDMEDAYRSVISQGTDSPLCEDVCIRDPHTNARYAVRFYACQEYTFDEIRETLYALAQREKIDVYTDTWKNIELWLTRADQILQCGWERVDDEKRVEQIQTLNRTIDLP